MTFKVVSFSTANHPDSWAVDPGSGLLELKTPMDAKIAEEIFHGMEQEKTSLRIRLHSATCGNENSKLAGEK